MDLIKYIIKVLVFRYNFAAWRYKTNFYQTSKIQKLWQKSINCQTATTMGTTSHFPFQSVSVVWVAANVIIPFIKQETLWQTY